MSGDVKNPKTKAFLLYKPNAREGMCNMTSMLKNRVTKVQAAHGQMFTKASTDQSLIQALHLQN